MNAFHAYDVRGVYGRDFGPEDVYRIGYHLVDFLGVSQVAVGRDDRESSPEIHERLLAGITDAGADVLDLGLATTPMVYYATASRALLASVQITASHNPREYNGLKISRENAQPVGLDSGLGEIARRVRELPTPPVAQAGRVIPLDVRADYVAFLNRYSAGLEGLNIAVDCSNGMAGLLIHDILPPTYHYLYDTLDGTFPNHEANPLVAENTLALRQLVVQKGCDAGIIFDGDGDRVVFVDERGKQVPSDLMLAVMGRYFLATRPSHPQPVLVDIRTSRTVGEYLAPMGGEVQMWRVGRAYMASKLREIDGLFGGELAGHYYFREFFYSDSGILAALILLRVLRQLREEGKTLGQLIAEINPYYNTGELNFTIADKEAAMRAVRDYFTRQAPPTALYDYDGYRVEYPEWWFNIRQSNTEPLLRFVAEAEEATLLETKVEEAREVLRPFLSEQ